jgi:hypothetical protein
MDPIVNTVAAPSRTLTILRKTGIGLAGFILLAFGLALIVLPGPAVVVIPLALALLATEFAWARRLLQRLTGALTRLKESLPFFKRRKDLLHTLG